MWQLSLLGYKIRLVHPEYFLLVAGIAAAAVLLLLAWVGRVGRVRREVPGRLLDKVIPGWSPAREGTRLSTILLGLLLLSMALVQPQCGAGTELARKVGIDVVVALDVSHSMEARDVKPSRLARARLELSDLIDHLRGDRFGLVVFAGTAFVQCPLTTDYAAAKLFLKAVDPGAMPVQGTDIGTALDEARQLLHSRRGTRSQVVVLLTDGEDHGPDTLSIAHTLHDEGIRVYTVGIGSKSGEPIPILDHEGHVVGYKKDEAGNTVLSRLDPKVLEQLAKITGGRYIHATDGSIGMSKVIHDLDHLQKAEFESRMTTRFEDRSVFLILPGFLLLLFGTVLRPSRRRPPPGDAGRGQGGDGGGGGGGEATGGKGRKAGRGTGRAAGQAAAIVLLLLAPALGGWRPFAAQHPAVKAGNDAYAAGHYDDALKAYDRALKQEKHPGDRARIQFNRGTTLAAQGKVKQARKAFDAALDGADDSLKARDFYNLGTALLRTHDPKHAVNAFIRSLKLDPQDAAAKYNLELALRQLKQKQKPPPKQGSKQDQKQQQNKQQNQDQKGGQKQQQNKQQADRKQQGQQGKDQQGKQGQKQQQEAGRQGDQKQQKQGGQQQKKPDQPGQEQQAKAGEKPGQKQQAKPGQQQPDQQGRTQGQKGKKQPGQGLAAARPEKVGRQDGKRILDALRQGEKPLQMQLFQLKNKAHQAPPGGKDW